MERSVDKADENSIATIAVASKSKSKSFSLVQPSNTVPKYKSKSLSPTRPLFLLRRHREHNIFILPV